MIFSAEHIERPCSGMYTEKIYDITSSWNSQEWTWIKFTDEDGEWCGEFRGAYRGTSVSEKHGIVVVLTTDYIFILDKNTSDVIEYDSQPSYVDITTNPNGDIFLTDGYGIEIFSEDEDGKIERIPITNIPVNPDNLKFEEWDHNILKISCCEFYNWENEIELYLDCDSMEWIENSQDNELEKSLTFKEKIIRVLKRKQ